MPLKNLYLTVPVGQSVRDFLVLGIVPRLIDLLPDFRLVILTPSYNVPEFLELCPKHERIVVRRMELPVRDSNRLRSWRLRLRKRAVVRMLLKLESEQVQLPQYLVPTFRELPPFLVVSTHPRTSHDYEIVMAARRLGVQTLGVVKSWDNVAKGLSSQPHLLSVWNPVNKEEAVRLLRYRPDEVEINGGTSFDPYYDPAYHLQREKFFRCRGLDPSRKLITLATSGVLDRGFYGRDETYLVEDILWILKRSPVLKGVQLLIRLHPMSRLDFFLKYWGRADIKFSMTSYMPGITWCPTKQDVVEQTNILRHSDVIVTPGSSWVLEAAIFDTPTVAPLYSDFQPDHAAAQFGWALDRHLKPLAEKNWVPITRSREQTQTAIEEAITQPTKYASARKSIVDNYIYYRDSHSSRRVAEWIARISESAQPGRPRGF